MREFDGRLDGGGHIGSIDDLESESREESLRALRKQINDGNAGARRLIERRTGQRAASAAAPMLRLDGDGSKQPGIAVDLQSGAADDSIAPVRG